MSVHPHLAELWPQLRRVECVQVVECALVMHGPHQREAVAVREQGLDAVTDLEGRWWVCVDKGGKGERNSQGEGG